MAGWLTGWSYRRKLTTTAAVSGTVEASFPATLFAPNLTGKVLASLNDAVLTGTDGTTVLDYGWRSKVASGGLGDVRLDAAFGALQDVGFLYYGNADAADQSDAEGVWDADHHAAWLFEEASGALADATANDIDLAVLGGPLYGQSGKVGSCLKWTTSTNTRASVADTSTSNRYTIEAWVKPTTLVDSYPTIVTHATSDGNTLGRLFAITSSGKPAGGHSNSAGTLVYVTGTNALSTSEWTHLAVSYDGTNIRLYVNGSFDTQTAVATHYNKLAQTMRVGGLYDDNWDGWIDEATFSHVARSDAWIKARYLGGANGLLTWGEEETATVSTPPGPTSAHVVSVGARAKVYGGGATAVNVTPGTRAIVR